MPGRLRAVIAGAIACPLFLFPATETHAWNGNKFFIGLGLSRNDIHASKEGTGFQTFGGYRLGLVAATFSIDVEAGYMDTGEMTIAVSPGRTVARIEGGWATLVGRWHFSREIEWLARVGADFGEDDGLMAGIGIGYHLSALSTLRFEAVERQEVSSLQLNLVFRQ